MIRIENKDGKVQGYLLDTPPDDGAGELFSAANTRKAVITAGANFAVPEYTVGAHRLEVYLDGVLCACGTEKAAQYAEVGSEGAKSAAIRWHDDIPKDRDILVRVV